MDVLAFPENLKTTSALSILLHGVISLPDVTSYDKKLYLCQSRNTIDNYAVGQIATSINLLNLSCILLNDG